MPRALNDAIRKERDNEWTKRPSKKLPKKLQQEAWQAFCPEGKKAGDPATPEGEEEGGEEAAVEEEEDYDKEEEEEEE